MNVLHHILKAEVGRRFLRRRGKGEEIFGGLNFGIGVAEDAIVLEDQLHFLRAKLESEKGSEMFRLGDALLFHRLGELFLQVIVKAVEISSLLLRDNGLAALAFGLEQCGELGRDAGRGLVRRQGRG
jgi:hypothetical protein